MRAVVTGGAGFLGSHLVDRMIAADWSVIVIDNLITGNLENVGHLFGHPNFHFVKQDVTEYVYVEGDVDWVFHFASPASPIDFVRYPIPVLKVGALGTHKALGLAKHKGASFMLASTSEVYGDPLVTPQPETYWGNVNPIGPRGVYDEAKRYAEAMTMAYHNFHGLDTRIARFFNTYGPRMRLDDGRAVPSFVSQAMTGEPLTVYGDGLQTRSFAYVDDIIDGVWKLAHARFNDPVNLGNDDEMTILAFAEAVKRVTGSSSKIVFAPAAEDDPRQRRPDLTRARNVLKWEAETTLEVGLAKTIASVKDRLPTPDSRFPSP
ncbi:MAG: SDR family oxidoreductase [Fimbriimonadaceae bacterium]|nr:SDR family oxidoreductase [Chthonomonadaceae bacterium]MCO5297680.1 SDR family oxidoreductase [Fimbriimonadaceae bacterium]